MSTDFKLIGNKKQKTTTQETGVTSKFVRNTSF